MPEKNASTLRRKFVFLNHLRLSPSVQISASLGELPPQDAVSLRDDLALTTSVAGGRPVASSRQLCLVVATLTVRAGNRWPNATVCFVSGRPSVVCASASKYRSHARTRATSPLA